MVSGLGTDQSKTAGQPHRTCGTEREKREHHRTLKEICEEYGISKSYLCYLLKQYRESGKKRIAATKYYSEEFKLGIVKQHYEGGTAIAKLVKETGSRYAKEGYAGLTTRKQPKPPVETQLQFTRNTSTISFLYQKAIVRQITLPDVGLIFVGR